MEVKGLSETQLLEERITEAIGVLPSAERGIWEGILRDDYRRVKRFEQNPLVYYKEPLSVHVVRILEVMLRGMEGYEDFVTASGNERIEAMITRMALIHDAGEVKAGDVAFYVHLDEDLSKDQKEAAAALAFFDEHLDKPVADRYRYLFSAYILGTDVLKRKMTIEEYKRRVKEIKPDPSLPDVPLEAAAVVKIADRLASNDVVIRYASDLHKDPEYVIDSIGYTLDTLRILIRLKKQAESLKVLFLF